MKRAVCVLLPGRLDKPVGGHKVIYQYSNYLAENGWAIIIANSAFLPSNENRWIELLRKGYACFRMISRSLRRLNTCAGWFSLNESIREKSIWSYSASHIPKADYYIATDALTAPYLLNYDVPDDHKLYFIQGFENWRLTDIQLRATYHLPVKIVVVSSWLQKIMTGEGVSCQLVPNGINLKEFSLTIPIRQKETTSISMIYNTAPMKNIRLGFEALEIVHQRIPNLNVLLFGVHEKPENLPAWYTYYHCPDQETHRLINNRAAIFIATSNSEGWGLPVLEAMACGQAVVCTDCKGYLEVACHNENALVSPVGDSESFANNILKLILDDDLRCAIASTGYKTAQNHSIQNSCKAFADCL